MDDCVVTMNATRKVDASFVVSEARLTVQLSGTGNGRVISANGDIDCGNTCIAATPLNATVQLQAQASAGNAFLGWGGDCAGVDPCSVTMNTTHTVTAAFGIPVPLSLSIAGSGRVTAFGLDCSQSCSKSYVPNTVVSLVATPSFGWTFQGWSGACAGTGTCNVSMSAAKSVTATFTFVASFGFVVPQDNSETVQAGGPAQYYIFIQRNPSVNETVTLTVSGLPPGASYTFSSPTLAGGAVSSLLTINTSRAVAQQRSVTPIEVWLALPVVAILFSRRRRGIGLMMIAIIAIALGTPACGGGGGGGGSSAPPPTTTTTSPSGTPVGTYTITITGTSPSTVKTMTVVLKVI
jgi:hypothetical protein